MRPSRKPKIPILTPVGRAAAPILADTIPRFTAAEAGGGAVRSPLAPQPSNPNAQPSATSRILPRSVYKVDPYEDMRNFG